MCTRTVWVGDPKRVLDACSGNRALGLEDALLEPVVSLAAGETSYFRPVKARFPYG
jgi:hypothetical protein